MRLRNFFVAGATVCSLAGCAAKHSPTVTYDEPPTEKWTGSLQPTQQRSGQLVVTSQNRTFGSISLRRTSMGTMQRIHVSLTLSIPSISSQQLRWAILPERCGTGELPLTGFDQFPLLEIGSNGRGQVDTDLPLDMNTTSAYHVNVYLGGQQLDNVVSCGNIKYETAQVK
ncbi:MAG: hypothetical protein ABJE10_22180 [bacterium]